MKLPVLRTQSIAIKSIALSASLLAVSTVLTGCSLVGTAPTVAPKVALGKISGIVHGGRQPVVGANVYVYQASTTGYGGSGIAASALNASTPLLTSAVSSSCGAGGAATAVADLNPADSTVGTITAINVTMQGAGYVGAGGGSLPPTVTITDPTGTGATATAVLNAGNGLASITITNPGSGYTAPVVTITPASTNPCQDAAGNYYVSSDANGNFSLPAGDYTCTTGLPVYVYTLGGDAGGGSPGQSGTLGDDGFMSVLGICGATTGPGVFNASTYLAVNELTTVAAAYATAGFATNPTHIGVLVQQTAPSTLTSSLTSLQTLEMTGLTNAFLTATNLYPSTTGNVGASPLTTPNGNGTLPNTKLNTLGNILADCVNSVNVSYSCENLLALTPGQTDTAGAAIYIAQHPVTNASSFYGLLAGNGQAYQPVLTKAPYDWTIGIIYTGGGLTTEGTSTSGVTYTGHSMAVDGSGNVWVVGAIAGNTLSGFSSLGVPLAASGFTGGSMNEPVSVAVDAASQNLWISNLGTTTGLLTEFNISGSTLNSIEPLNGTAAALNEPFDAEFDASGNIWVASFGNADVVKLTSAGVYTAKGTNTTYLPDPISIAAEPNGMIWSVGENKDYSTLWTSADVLSAEAKGKDSVFPVVAIDASGTEWVMGANSSTQGNTIVYLSKEALPGTATPTSYEVLPTDAVYYPSTFSLVLDGAGNVFVPDNSNGWIYEYNNSGTLLSGVAGYIPTQYPTTAAFTLLSAPPTGYIQPYNIVSDGSGNVWFSNDGATNGTKEIEEMVGVAVPVVTPLSYGVANTMLATRP